MDFTHTINKFQTDSPLFPTCLKQTVSKQWEADQIKQTDRRTSLCLVCKVSLGKAVSDWIPSEFHHLLTSSNLTTTFPPPSPSSTLYLLRPHHPPSSRSPSSPSSTLYLLHPHTHPPPPFASTFTLLPSPLTSPSPTITIYFLQPHPLPPSISSTLPLFLHPHSPTLHIFSVRLFSPSKKGKTLGSNQICVIGSRRLCGGAWTERR